MTPFQAFLARLFPGLLAAGRARRAEREAARRQVSETVPRSVIAHGVGEMRRRAGDIADIRAARGR